MGAPVIVPASTGISQPALSDVLQVDTSNNPAAPTWVTVFGMQAFTAGQSAQTSDNSDADTGNWSSVYVASQSWEWTGTFAHKTYTGAYDVGQAYLEAAAKADPVVPIHVRRFNRFNLPGAQRGMAYPQVTPAGGGKQDEDKLTVTLSGVGAPVAISNPKAVATAPSLLSVLDPGGTSTFSTGEIAILTGSNMSAATDIKFGATSVAAGTLAIIGDNKLSTIVPAVSNGATAVTVINAAGTSNAVSVTKV